jgi:hypothetical protein
MKTELEESGTSDNSNTEFEQCAPFGFPADTNDVGDETKELEPVPEDNVVSVKAEVVDEDETNVSSMADGSPAPIWSPHLTNWLTAKTLFNSAMTISAFDPARMRRGFDYSVKLKRECDQLIPHPISKNNQREIVFALLTYRNNPGFFECQAIDIILTFFLNNTQRRNNNGRK